MLPEKSIPESAPIPGVSDDVGRLVTASRKSERSMKAMKQALGKKVGDKAILKFMVAHEFDLETAAGAVPKTPITTKKLPMAHLCVYLCLSAASHPHYERIVDDAKK